VQSVTALRRRGGSYIAQWAPRVKAVVACDNLGGPGPHDAPIPGGAPGSSGPIGEADCPADPSARTTGAGGTQSEPGLGISADYGLPPVPNTSLPDPNGKSTEWLAFTKAGVDTGEIIIRGGSHLDFRWIPNQAFGSSLRGPDITDWYTILAPRRAPRGGGTFDCEDLRDGCPGMVGDDGYRGNDSYLAIDTSPDS
jgi:hypothetical protein